MAGGQRTYIECWYVKKMLSASPVLWANVEPDEYVGDGLEEEEGDNRKHGQERK